MARKMYPSDFALNARRLGLGLAEYLSLKNSVSHRVFRLVDCQGCGNRFRPKSTKGLGAIACSDVCKFVLIAAEFVHDRNACWEWPLSCNQQTGYGQFNTGKTTPQTAHRFSFELFRGPSDQPYICHHCDNRPCFNPWHLFPGTALDNSRDMVAKGRQNFFNMRIHQ